VVYLRINRLVDAIARFQLPLV